MIEILGDFVVDDGDTKWAGCYGAGDLRKCGNGAGGGESGQKVAARWGHKGLLRNGSGEQAFGQTAARLPL
jgi:hypothetical protein